jgi:hypothetical protein
MDDGVIERARERLRRRGADPAAVEAALQRARDGIDGLAELAASLEESLPGRVEEAIREGVRAEALPVARQLAEVRGLSAQMIRRLERLEGDLLAERHARVDDLAVLVDLISSGWTSVDERLARLESALAPQREAAVYPLR